MINSALSSTVNPWTGALEFGHNFQCHYSVISGEPTKWGQLADLRRRHTGDHQELETLKQCIPPTVFTKQLYYIYYLPLAAYLMKFRLLIMMRLST